MELQLISASSRSENPLESSLTYPIPDTIQSLHDWKLWDQDLTPFRDRVMIQMMCSLPSVQTDLQEIMEGIDQELDKYVPQETVVEPPVQSVPDQGSAEPEVSCDKLERDRDIVYPVVRVAITCQDGTRMSPCYVEWLYDQYSHHRPPIGNLVITRKHCHAHTTISDASKKQGKLLVWQHTKLAMSYLGGVEQLVGGRLWTMFPFHTICLIEKEYNRNPFNEALKLPPYSAHKSDGEYYILNFVTGQMHSTKTSKKVYRVRCTISKIDDRLSCRMLENITYKDAARNYGAAGVLFYSAHPNTGEPMFLLGHINYACKTWCDFGGIKRFREKPRKTAARECYEETLGVLGETQHLFEMLGNYQENNVFKVVNEVSAYVSHFMRVPYDDYPSLFHETLLGPQSETVEVDEMRWFSLSSLRGAMKYFAVQESNLACPALESGDDDVTCCCPLRHEFLQTLCIAEKLGFLGYIQHICKQIHTQCLEGSKAEQGSHSATSTGCQELEEGVELLKLHEGEPRAGKDERHSTDHTEGCTADVEDDTAQVETEAAAESTLYYGMGAGNFSMLY